MLIKKNLHSQLIILGSGPAGYTAAIYAARSNLKVMLITGHEIGGQLQNTLCIENWPGEFNFISGNDLMKKMLKHVSKFNVLIINDHIIDSKLNKNPLLIIGEKKTYTCDALIIATGSYPKYLNLPLEKEYIGKGISTCALCDGFFYKDKIVAVIGGGNSALEESIYLSNIASTVYLIHRRNDFRADKIICIRLMEQVKKNKIKIYYNSTVNRIIVDKFGVKAIEIYLKSEKRNEIISVFGLFIAIGSTPNTKIFSNFLETKEGYIVVNKKNNRFTTQTNIKNIFAAGDVVDPLYRQAITSSSSGCKAAIDVERYLSSIK